MHNPKPASCPLCGAPASDLSYLETYTDPGRLTYDLWSCAACNAWHWNPLQNPGSEWYEHDERYAGRNEDPILEPTENHKRTVALLPPGRVLDVGCGVGNFLAHAKKHGWDCYGIDFDRDAIETGKRTFGLEHLYVSDLRAFHDANPTLRFDLITAFDVFEHIDNHEEFITLIHSMLVPHGHIAMTMPYRKRALWLMPGDVPPRHLTRWDRASLSAYLARHRFRVMRIERQSEGIKPILLKMRFRYGMRFTTGLVGKLKSSVKPKDGSAPTGSARLKVQLALTLARMKDIVLFGVPALMVFLWMLPTPQRYITLFVVAKRCDDRL